LILWRAPSENKKPGTAVVGYFQSSPLLKLSS
jgi:hypothetical protein